MIERKKHRRRCACGALCHTSIHIEQPTCWMCRRERLRLDALPPRGVRRSDGYWRAYYRHVRMRGLAA